MLTIIIIDLFHMAICFKVKKQMGGTRGEWLNYCLLELGHNPETSLERL